jgi:hypothetical protein
MLSTLRRVVWQEKLLPLLPPRSVLKTRVLQLLELTSRAA